MRAVVLSASLLLACGSGAAVGDTGLEIVVRYDSDSVRELSVTGQAAHPFGPYIVSSSTLRPGGVVSIRLDASDAGTASVCAQARDAGGRVLQVGCGTYDVHPGEIGHGTLDLAAIGTGQ
jgi:hypothetical protein